MNRISRQRNPDSPSGDFRLSATLPRIAAGATAALAVLAATFYIFGPFADLSARQLAAGPRSTELDQNGQPLVLAKTGRSWAADQRSPVVTGSGKPLAVLATSDENGRRRSR
jgi:hypothetical protein